MTFRFPLLVAAALLATSAWAQKPAERSPLEIGYDVAEVTVPDGTGRFLAEGTGQPRVLSFLNHAVTPGTPEAMAREFLAAEFGALRLASPLLSDLEYLRTSTTPGGTTVRFRQTVDGIPVVAPETVVHMDRQGLVQFVLNEYRTDLDVPETTPAITAEAARRQVFDHLGVQGDRLTDETDLVIYPTADGAHLAWNVRVQAETPVGDWDAFVDARTGDFLRVANRLVHHHPDEEDGGEPPSLAPTVEAARAMSRVDGTGFIFHPDPLTRAGVTYGTPGYVDGNDADTPQLTAARTAVTLQDITFDGTNYKLAGPYAVIVDFEGPFTGLFLQPSSDFSFTRFAQGFEAVNTYWHIDAMMRYINEDLGIALTPRQYSGGVQFDPHALNGADNSYYSGGRVAFGEGCVDDDEDADVIVHELGHGLHDWLAGGVSNGDGLSEGLGDFFANSYTRHLGLLTPSDPSYYWVFKWDGHNPCWPGRVTNFGGTYPSGSAPHQRGQHIATALMSIWDDIGGQKTDVATIVGIDMTNGGTQQPAAAQAILQAATDLGYSLAERQAMFDRFTAKGYAVVMPPPPVANEPGADLPSGYVLSDAYPNPFNPAATFTLQVMQSQQVTVTLYDAMGRQVRTLFEGDMAAGERQTLVIDASALASGLYVYRVEGETFSAARRVTLVK